MQNVLSSKLGDMVPSLLKNDSVEAKPVISFTEGIMFLLGRQSGFSTFSPMCCYSSIGMDAVGAARFLLAEPQSS